MKLPRGGLPSKFPYTLYKTRFEKIGATDPGDEGWAGYCASLTAFLPRAFEKKDLPLIYHGAVTDGRRRREHLVSLAALCFDCDEDNFQRPSAFLDSLREQGIAFVYQERVTPDGIVKFHLVLPLAEPITGNVYALGRVRTKAVRKRFEEAMGVKLDPSFDRPNQGLHPYCVRDGVIPFHDACLGPFALDLDAALNEWGVPLEEERVWSPPKDDLVKVAVLQDQIIRPDPSGRGWFIRCPFGPHAGGDTKTLLKKSGRIVCLAGRCQGRTQEEYEKALPDLVRVKLLNARKAQLLAAMAAETGERLPVERAPEAISEALDDFDIHSGRSLLLRVSPGGGKTHVAARWLVDYCAPVIESDLE